MSRSVVVQIVVADGEDPMLLRVATAQKLADLFGADPAEDRLEFGEASTTIVVSYDDAETLEDAVRPEGGE